MSESFFTTSFNLVCLDNFLMVFRKVSENVGVTCGDLMITLSALFLVSAVMCYFSNY